MLAAVVVAVVIQVVVQVDQAVQVVEAVVQALITIQQVQAHPEQMDWVEVEAVLVAAIFLGLWFYYDRRDYRRFERERRKTTFHCIRCDQLYTASLGSELCPCPRCAHENTRLKF